jgi:quercetin dioxygenase-like cupin family protein
MESDKAFRAHKGGLRWEGVELHAYKEEGSAPFKDITRQTLFKSETMAGELRYFEIAPGGHSTLERHEHIHAVMILHGSGRCLVGDEVRDVRALDLVSIPPMTWHQFRAGPDELLGFLCMVDRERDRPQLPSPEELEALKADPGKAAFLRADE